MMHIYLMREKLCLLLGRYFRVYFVLGFKFQYIIIMNIIGQIKYELLEVEYFIHIYFLSFILILLLFI